jgi:hypothetical protein
MVVLELATSPSIPRCAQLRALGIELLSYSLDGIAEDVGSLLAAPADRIRIRANGSGRHQVLPVRPHRYEMSMSFSRQTLASSVSLLPP